MKARLSIIFAFALCFMGASGFVNAAEKGKSGEELFKANCAACHPSGGNVINPHKTLFKKDLAANKVMTPADIVKVMRNPGPGMTRFDKKAIPDADAKKIADYIVSTFK